MRPSTDDTALDIAGMQAGQKEDLLHQEDALDRHPTNRPSGRATHGLSRGGPQLRAPPEMGTCDSQTLDGDDRHSQDLWPCSPSATSPSSTEDEDDDEDDDSMFESGESKARKRARAERSARNRQSRNGFANRPPRRLSVQVAAAAFRTPPRLRACTSRQARPARRL